MRFIINLPQEELESVERICFQVEEAQWFYEDFIRPLDPDLPSLSLRDFCLLIFQHCPLLSEFSTYHHSAAFSEFLAYKTRVPVRGSIMINQDMNEVVLVKGWKKGASWSFPRGKINKDEPDLDCAVREVYEETGFDVKEAGLVGNDEDTKYIDVTMREQHMRLYVFRGVPMDTYFEPRTRKEISKIQWYKLSELPTLKKKKQQQEGRGEDLATNANKFYMVAPFLNPLNKWIAQQRKLDKLNNQGQPNHGFNTVQNAHLSVVDQTSANGVNDHSATDDMGRLLANLRQSGQAATASDLPEVSESVDPAQDATSELKNLRVDSHSQAATNDTTPSSTSMPGVSEKLVTNGKDSSALLALLRGNRTAHEQVPHTPLEQVTEHPAVPRSPRHHNLHVPVHYFPMLPPPPRSPYPAVHNRQPKTYLHNTIHSSNSHPKTTGPPFQSHYPDQLTTSRTPPAQQYLQFFNSINSTPSAATAAKSNRQVPAPYQRTGDPEFSQRSQYSSSLPPSIPPASTLPPPKLTTHSSALLDLFKTKSPSKVALDTQPAEAPTAHLSVVSNVEVLREHSEVSPLIEQSNERDLHTAMDPTREQDQKRFKLAMWENFQATSERDNAEECRRIAAKDAERLAEESRTGIRYELELPTMNETWRQVKVDDQANQRKVVNVKKPAGFPQLLNGTVRIDSQHSTSKHVQESSPIAPTEPKDSSTSNPDHRTALLNLFRNPSTPTTQASKSTASLEPPSLPIELSAMPSPGHSRETSQTKPATSRPQSQNAINDSVFTQERPQDKVNTRKSPMAATVSGPLNVPNFDKIAQKPKEVNGQVENIGKGHMQKGQPLTIQSRPHDTKVSSQPEPQNTSAPVGSATVAPTSTLPLKETRKHMDTTPVPFQPQILRRPARKCSLSQAPPFSQVQAPCSSNEPLSLDHRGAQTQGHIETLLSLFSKPAPLIPATNSSSAALISPLSEKLVSQQGRSAIVSPLQSRSRMASLASPSGKEVVKSSAVHSPRSPRDKQFLLGYLEGVAKERR